MSIVASSSATSMRHALIAMSCVALASAPIPASRLNQPIASLVGLDRLSAMRMTPSRICAGTIHCLRRPSLRKPGIETLSIRGDHRNWNA